jgi:hypothetical protein
MLLTRLAEAFSSGKMRTSTASPMGRVSRVAMRSLSAATLAVVEPMMTALDSWSAISRMGVARSSETGDLPKPRARERRRTCSRRAWAGPVLASCWLGSSIRSRVCTTAPAVASLSDTTAISCVASTGWASRARMRDSMTAASRLLAITPIAGCVVISTSVTGSETMPKRSSGTGRVTPIWSSMARIAAGALLRISTMCIPGATAGCAPAPSPAGWAGVSATSSWATNCWTCSKTLGEAEITSELVVRSTLTLKGSPSFWAMGAKADWTSSRRRVAGMFSIFRMRGTTPCSDCACSSRATAQIWIRSSSSARTTMVFEASSPKMRAARGPLRWLANIWVRAWAITVARPRSIGMTTGSGSLTNSGTSSCSMICSMRSSSFRPAETIRELVCTSAETEGTPSVSMSTGGR